LSFLSYFHGLFFAQKVLKSFEFFKSKRSIFDVETKPDWNKSSF